jgi:glycosyltransferase involved in cell wall biosynthesis
VLPQHPPGQSDLTAVPDAAQFPGPACEDIALTPPLTPPPDTEPGVCILMGVYLGAAFLPAQLASIGAQSHRNWALIAADDSPHDDGGAGLIADFAAVHPDRAIACRPGARAGFARNFLTLLQAVPADMPFAALCDQDDVWFPDKLARAVAMLATLPGDEPALYCARTVICDEDLHQIGLSPQFARPPDFRNALVQSIGGGNTMVLNRAAIDLAAAAAAETAAIGDPVAHDWWLYQLVTGCGGRVLRDSQPALFYRQHGGNLIGANLSAMARASRLLALLGGRFRRWNDTGLAALGASRHRLTPQAQAILARFEAARSGPVWRRLRALRASGVFRQGRAGTAALWIACLVGRL